MRRSLVTLAAVALAGAAACSSSAGAPAAANSPAASLGPSGPPADGGSYTSTDAVLAALKAAGEPCSNPNPVANPSATGALSMVDCSAFGQDDTVVVVFDNHQDAQGYAEGMTSMGDLSADAVVYGQDWAVNAISAYAPKVQAALGGGILEGPGPSAS